MDLATLLRMAADAHGDRVAFGPREGGLTYADLSERAAAGATWLAEHEVPRLVYLGVNDTAFPVALFAAAWAGIPLVPLNYRLGAETVRVLLAEQGPGAAVIADAAPGAQGPVLDPSEWLAATSPGGTPPAPEAAVDPESIAVVLYTSGTTARPKAAVLRHRHLTSYVLESVEFASAEPDAAALLAVPPYHVAGVANVVTNVHRGRRVVQLPRFTPQAWVDLARREAVTHALVVPTMLARIVEAAGDDLDLPALRSLAYGGARMPRPVIERALRLLPAVDFVNAYGLTETSSTIAVLGPDDHRLALHVDDPVITARLGSVGRVLPGIDVEVRDADGTVLPPGHPGELFVRGPQVSGEYLGVAVGPADGWFATRDRGWLDADGYLFIGSRADDTIIRGGENIAPAEVEDVLLAHPGVAEAAVVGVPDDEWGQRVVAVVIPRAGHAVDVDQLRAFCRERLRSSRAPAQIHVWSRLPRTDTGKLLRREVAARLGADA